jgi:hypothetical protein
MRAAPDFYSKSLPEAVPNATDLRLTKEGVTQHGLFYLVFAKPAPRRFGRTIDRRRP